MNFYQSFTHYADGDWDIEFHCQHTDQHPAFVARLYWGPVGWGWIWI